MTSKRFRISAKTESKITLSGRGNNLADAGDDANAMQKRNRISKKNNSSKPLFKMIGILSLIGTFPVKVVLVPLADARQKNEEHGGDKCAKYMCYCEVMFSDRTGVSIPQMEKLIQNQCCSLSDEQADSRGLGLCKNIRKTGLPTKRRIARRCARSPPTPSPPSPPAAISRTDEQ